jgi:hypothetical protein
LASAAALVLWVATGLPGKGGDDTVLPRAKQASAIVARREGRVAPLDRAHPDVAARRRNPFRRDPHRSFPPVPLHRVGRRPRARQRLFPFDGAESARIDHVGRWEIAGAIVLDDAPGPRANFRALLARAALQGGGDGRARRIGRKGWDGIRATERLDLAGVEQSSFVIEKSPPSKP